VLGTDDSAAVAIGDLNRDGRPDIALANYNPSSVSVGLNRGGGRFSGREYDVGGLARSVAIDDLNGDGEPDIVTANQGPFNPFTVSVLLNSGAGHFAASRDYEIGRDPVAIATGDLNGDGKPDLAVANRVTSSVLVLLNRGDGTFLPGKAYATARHPSSIAIGDLNGDAKLDLAAANSDDRSVSVLISRGDGSFEGKRDYPVGRTPQSIAIADLDRNGKPDLVAANWGSATDSVLLNRGDGSFQVKRDYLTGDGPFAVAVGDLNGDRASDVVTANTEGTVSVLLNRGNGSFQPKLDYAPGLDLFGWGSIAIGDLTGDRRLDLAVPMVNGRNSYAYLSLLINRPGLCNVQNVLGMTVTAAKHSLARINCRIGTVRRAYSRRTQTGRVTLQKPTFGAVLPRGGRVNLVVGRGRRP
jgi:hypothetical protein